MNATLEKQTNAQIIDALKTLGVARSAYFANGKPCKKEILLAVLTANTSTTAPVEAAPIALEIEPTFSRLIVTAIESSQPHCTLARIEEYIGKSKTIRKSRGQIFYRIQKLLARNLVRFSNENGRGAGGSLTLRTFEVA